MKTRLLGAAVLIALLVLFVPMFFSSEPPVAGGDQSVSLAIPQAPDRELQTRTMSLAPDGAVPANSTVTPPMAPGAAPVSSDQLATVNIGSSRPRDVEIDPEAGKPPVPTTVTTGSGTSPAQPVIPLQTKSTASTPAASTPTASTPPSKPPVVEPKPTVVTPPATTPAAVAAHGSYMLNLSAYASAAGAASLQRQVQALGYPAHGRVITQAGQQRTLVTAGPFETRAAAEAARLKITQSIPGAPARLEQDASRQDTVAARPAPALAAGTSARAGGWAVQLAAMSSQSDAHALRDKLRANGFDGYVDSVNAGGKQLWRVRAGPQTQRADAQRVHDQIQAKLGLAGNVVTVP